MKVPGSTRRIEALAAALRRVAIDRGRPCTINSTDLLRLYKPPGLTQNDPGRIGRSTFAMMDLYRALGGRQSWGSAPTYTQGVWAL